MTQRNLKDKARLATAKFSPPSITLSWGEISVHDSTVATVIASSGVKVQVTQFDTNGQSNNTTPDHINDHITIGVAGTYFVACSIASLSVMGAAAVFDFTVYKNNGAIEFTNLDSHRNLSGGGGDAGSASLSGLASFNEDDTVELWVTNDSNTQNIIVEDCNLSVMRLGGN